MTINRIVFSASPQKKNTTNKNVWMMPEMGIEDVPYGSNRNRHWHNYMYKWQVYVWNDAIIIENIYIQNTYVRMVYHWGIVDTDFRRLRVRVSICVKKNISQIIWYCWYNWCIYIFSIYWRRGPSLSQALASGKKSSINLTTEKMSWIECP